MMKVFRTLQSVAIGPSACAIGMFDGIHLGHHMVLEQAIRVAKINQLESVVFTFTNHPQSVVSKTPTPLLSTVEERLAAFEAMGFDAVLMLDFTSELKDMPAETFVQSILLDTLHVKAVSVGYDHRFGKNRQGDGPFLKTQGQIHGFEVYVIEPVRVDHQIVSSTLIRKLLSYGDLDKANQLMGRPYTLTGAVVGGVGRGKSIGFPTANLDIPPQLLVPAQGVYAGTVRIEGESQVWPAVCNIGLAPTFGDQIQPRMEVHILDYNQDLYGKTLTFTFLHHLRKERVFPSVDALIAQLHDDCQEARTLLHSGRDPSP
jgi:riboflavin kinase / FMN adenylyltransferase